MATEIIKTGKSPHPLIWVAGIAVILFSVAGLAAIMGWIPTSMGGSSVISSANNQPAAKSTASRQTNARERTAPAQVASTAPVSAPCSSCGVIESVREITTKGEGTGLGAAGGAVVGGLLGHQVGGGSGKKIATVVGAVGGAVAGNEVEKRVKSSTSYDITVRLENGSTTVVHEASPPSWRTGDHVKVVDGVIRAN